MPDKQTDTSPQPSDRDVTFQVSYSTTIKPAQLVRVLGLDPHGIPPERLGIDLFAKALYGSAIEDAHGDIASYSVVVDGEEVFNSDTKPEGLGYVPSSVEMDPPAEVHEWPGLN